MAVRRKLKPPPVDPRTKTLSETTLECRKLGHNWVEIFMTAERAAELEKDNLYEETLACSRCTSKRVATYNAFTDERVASPKYDPADGYRLPDKFRGQGRLSRSAARRALRIRRQQQMALAA